MQPADFSADFRLFLGATGCGKTTAALKQLDRSAAIIAVSPKASVDQLHIKLATGLPINSVRALRDRLAFAKIGAPLVINSSWTAGAAEFAAICANVRAYRARYPDSRRVIILADELHTMLSSSRKELEPVLQIANAGRVEGISLYGISQRPMHIPTDVRGATTRLWVGRLPLPADCKIAADMLDTPVATIKSLSGYDCIERDMLSGKKIFSTKTGG